MTEDELLDLQRSEDAAMDADSADMAQFIAARERAAAEQAFTQGFRDARGSDREIRPQAKQAPIDLNRPKINNRDGSFSTESTIGVNIDGIEYTIPTIVNGKRVSPDQAVELFKSGDNPAVGQHGSIEEAEAYARQRSSRIGELRGVNTTSKSLKKQEMNSFKAQVNQQTRVGDSGGNGARMRANPPTAAEGLSRVKINKGDTLWALSQKYGMSVDELRALNSGVDPRRLQIGAELKLRADAPAMAAEAEASGPSVLAQKLAAMRGEKRSGVPYGELARGFHNNPDNTATLDTAGNYLNAAAGVGGIVAAPRLAGLLALASSKVAPRAGQMARNTEQMADRLFPEGNVLRRARRMYDE